MGMEEGEGSTGSDVAVSSFNVELVLTRDSSRGEEPKIWAHHVPNNHLGSETICCLQHSFPFAAILCLPFVLFLPSTCRVTVAISYSSSLSILYGLLIGLLSFSEVGFSALPAHRSLQLTEVPKMRSRGLSPPRNRSCSNERWICFLCS